MRGRISYDRGGKNPRFYVGDAEVTEAEFRRLFPPRPLEFGGAEVLTTGTTTWPLVSDALAVHPKQVEQANARNKRHGIGTRYLKNGRAVIPDRGDRKRLLKLEGFFDKSGGYGDG